jgi:hypothetical protein
MRLIFDTQLDTLPGVGSANVVLGLFAVAEALRLGAGGEAYRALHKAEREIGLPLRYWRYVIAPSDLWAWSVRRTPASDLLVTSITSGPLPAEVAILTAARIGSLEAEIERLLDRIRRAFQSIVGAATRSAQAQTVGIEETSSGDSFLIETIRASVQESAEDTPGNRRAAMSVTAAATAWLRDGLIQIGARDMAFEDEEVAG